MFNIETYIKNIIESLQEKFGSRLLYVGLQGSYLREEATEDSDADIMVIIDELSVRDLTTYKKIIAELETPEKSCGFLCGRAELEKWNPLEINSLLYGTKDYYGKLAEYVPQYNRNDIVNFTKVSIGNLYHEICHRYLHADFLKNKNKLPHSYKNVFFILQSAYYLRTGVFYPTKKELLNNLSEKDKEVLEMAVQLKNNDDYDFEKAFSVLFTWSQEILYSL